MITKIVYLITKDDNSIDENIDLIETLRNPEKKHNQKNLLLNE